MNEMAAHLGLTNTHYTDPSGLESTNVSSAYDLSHLIAFAASDPTIGPIMRTATYEAHTSTGPIAIHSTNKLLGTDVDVRGGKTGFISKAGYCLATLLQIPQGSQVAVVVLGAANSATRFWEARHLFNWVVGRARRALIGGGRRAPLIVKLLLINFTRLMRFAPDAAAPGTALAGRVARRPRRADGGIRSRAVGEDRRPRDVSGRSAPGAGRSRASRDRRAPALPRRRSAGRTSHARPVSSAQTSRRHVARREAASRAARRVRRLSAAVRSRRLLRHRRRRLSRQRSKRFALLSVAALDIAQHDLTERIDVVHAHDWQAGLVPALLRTEPQRWPRVSRAGLVFTIHNLAYQGLFPRTSVPALGLDWQVFAMEGAEFWGQISFLKAGINYSDMVTTVSPTYAEETLTAGIWRGLGRRAARQGDRYVGILNGIDTETWNPATDKHLPAHFDADQLDGKRVCKRALLERFALPVGDDALARPVIGMVSRLVDQKGLDLVEAASRRWSRWTRPGCSSAAAMPSHERVPAALWRRATRRASASASASTSALAHLVEAGADMFLMPSRFEPCGLNQMYSLRYGTVPVVHGVGGLDDTIQPYTARARRANGFKFREATADAPRAPMQQAVRLYAGSARHGSDSCVKA